MKNNKQKKKTSIFAAIILIIILLFTTNLVSSDCAPTPYPSDGKSGHSMIYDNVNDVIIIYGGTTYMAWEHMKYDTRSYDYNNNEWTNLRPSVRPYQSSWGAMAYDSESARTILFGGTANPITTDGYESDETWAYDYSTNVWKKMNPSISPGNRTANCMAYDSESDVIIMHGGGLGWFNSEVEYVHYNDTWAYDFNTDTWTNMEPTGLDVGVDEAQMTYDSESDRIIMFGGYFISPYNGDSQEDYYATETWAYDYNSNTWENITTTIHPSIRVDHALAYDSESDRVILTGGWNMTTYGTSKIDQRSDETWAFDYNTQTWENMNPTNQPGRFQHKMAYDSESDLIIFFGGINDTQRQSPFNEIHTYDYNSNNWTLMSQEFCPTKTNFYLLPIISFFAVITILRILRKRKA
jgi:N-acetylneuraminic acid mutarotase